MKHLKSAIALLLVLTMLLALTACGDDPAPATTGSVTTAPAETVAPTETTPDLKSLYADAKAAALALQDVQLQVTSDASFTAGPDTFTSAASQTILFQGLGSDAMTVQVDEDAQYGDKRVTAQHYFAGGKGYTTCAGASFFTPMDAADFCSLLSPVALLDETLYSSVTAEETKSGQKLTFTGADTIEAWISDASSMVPVEITGTAVLDENNALKETTYQLTYTLGGLQGVTSFKTKIKTPEEIPDMTPILARLNSKAIEIPSLVLPMAIEQAKGFIQSATSLTSTVQHSCVSAAGDLMTNFVTSFDTFGTGADYGCKISNNNTFSDFSGNTQNLVFDEVFADGLYTMTEKGSEPESDPSITADMVGSFLSDSLVNHLPALSVVDSLSMEATGTNLMITYTLNEDGAAKWQQRIAADLFEDPKILDNAASDYKTGELSGSLSLDLITGLPVALTSTYSGTHTIDGTEYALAEAYLETLFLGSNTSYEAIHGVPMPEEKPANPAAPLFYHVTGGNGEEMWLLGTIHVGDSRTGYLPQAVYDAFDASDALAVEFDIQQFDEDMLEDPELALTIVQSFYYTDGTRLADHVDADLYQAAITALKATGNYDLNGTAEALRPAIAATLLDNYVTRYCLDVQKGVDNRLLTRAKASGKPILNVESAEAQFGMMADFSDDLQQLLLANSLQTDPFQACQDLLNLYELWCRGDEAALIEAINEGTTPEGVTEDERKLLEEYWNALGSERNDDMLEIATEYLTGGDVVFYAVGLAHLLAEDGLVNALRAAGYTVELVPLH